MPPQPPRMYNKKRNKFRRSTSKSLESIAKSLPIQLHPSGRDVTFDWDRIKDLATPEKRHCFTKEEIDLLFYKASSEGRLDAVQQLFQGVGADANGQQGPPSHSEPVTVTPLIIAVRKGNKKVVEYLLTVPQLDVNAPDKNEGETALHSAVQTGSVEMVQMLLRHPCIDVNRKTPRKGLTPLHYAAFHNCVKIARLLVDAGANLHIRSGTLFQRGIHLLQQDTPLDWACKVGNVEMVTFLVREAKCNLYAMKRVVRFDSSVPTEDQLYIQEMIESDRAIADAKVINRVVEGIPHDNAIPLRMILECLTYIKNDLLVHKRIQFCTPEEGDSIQVQRRKRDINRVAQSLLCGFSNSACQSPSENQSNLSQSDWEDILLESTECLRKKYQQATELTCVVRPALSIVASWSTQK